MRELRYSEDQPRDSHGRFGEGSSVKTEPDVAYAKGLSDRLKEQYNQKGAYGSVPDAVSSLAFRTPYDDPSFAMAQHMEAAGGQDAMVAAMSSGMDWNTYPDGATKEWQAAQAQGANTSISNTTRDALKNAEPLTEKEKAAFAARTQFVQAKVEKEHGAEFTVYRGVNGAYAQKLKGLDDVAMPVRGLTSFTTDKRYAYDFAGKNGVVVSATVKASDVFWTNESAPNRVVRYENDRGEKVILSKGPTMAVKIHAQLTRSLRYAPNLERRWANIDPLDIKETALEGTDEQPITIILFRHGQTKSDANNEFCGWTDEDMDDEGLAAVEEAADEVLSHLTFTRVFSDDLQRTYHTAEVALKYATDATEVIVNQGARTWDVGDLAGKPKTPENLAEKQYYVDHPKRIPPGSIECLAESKQRWIQFLFYVAAATPPGETSLVACHSSNFKTTAQAIHRKAKVWPSGLVRLTFTSQGVYATVLRQGSVEQQYIIDRERAKTLSREIRHVPLK